MAWDSSTIVRIGPNWSGATWCRGFGLGFPGRGAVIRPVAGHFNSLDLDLERLRSFSPIVLLRAAGLGMEADA